LIVGGITPSRIASRHTIADSAPAAPIRWPVIDLGELVGIRSASSGSAIRSARVSAASLARVPVPCAQM
jgi:hypothetical protein